MQLNTYANPSQITFEIEEEAIEPITVSDVGRGVTFLYRGAVCMRTEVSGFQVVKGLANCDSIQKELRSAPFLINLQTGRTFLAAEGEYIQFVKVRMLVSGRALERQATESQEEQTPETHDYNVARLVGDLTLAARTLRRYEKLHREKGTPESLDKAGVNKALAEQFESTLDSLNEKRSV